MNRLTEIILRALARPKTLVQLSKAHSVNYLSIDLAELNRTLKYLIVMGYVDKFFSGDSNYYEYVSKTEK
jgi:hypothetical protein